MENKEIQPTLYERTLKKEWSYYTGAVLVSLIAMTLLALTGGTWGASGPFAIWGAKFFSLFFGLDENGAILGNKVDSYNFFAHKFSVIDISMTLGALISCLLAAQWKIRKIKHWKQSAAGLLGGLLMGLGAKIAGGCNIGGLFSQLPQFTGNGWVFFLFVFLGATLGGKLLKFFIPPVSNKRPDRKRLSPEERRRKQSIQIAIGCALLVALLLLGFILSAMDAKYTNVPYWIVIGLGFGYVMQRSRFCFTAAYRDPMLTHETKLTKAVLAAFALCSIFFFGYHVNKFGLDLSVAKGLPGAPISLNLMIGSFLFGIGAVLAGGCASGTFVRMGEGYVQTYIAFVGFSLGGFLGTPLVVATKGSFLSAGPKLYLPSVVGYIPALIIQLLALLGLWILADWWERKKRVN